MTCPVAAFFAEHDVLPGATVDDACVLREQLRDNEKVSECASQTTVHYCRHACQYPLVRRKPSAAQVRPIAELNAESKPPELESELQLKIRKSKQRCAACVDYPI